MKIIKMKKKKSVRIKLLLVANDAHAQNGDFSNHTPIWNIVIWTKCVGDTCWWVNHSNFECMIHFSPNNILINQPNATWKIDWWKIQIFTRLNECLGYSVLQTALIYSSSCFTTLIFLKCPASFLLTVWCYQMLAC